MKNRIRELCDIIPRLPPHHRKYNAIAPKLVKTYVLTEREELIRTAARVLSHPLCTSCQGGGVIAVSIQTRASMPCNCVYRAVFRIVHRSYISQTDRGALPRLEMTSAGAIYSIPSVEFRADFEITARRVLDAFHHKLFRIYCLQGGDLAPSIVAMQCTRGHFLHSWYRVQEQVGNELLTMTPSLFPVPQYFQIHRHIEAGQIVTQRRTPWPAAALQREHESEYRELQAMAA